MKKSVYAVKLVQKKNNNAKRRPFFCRKKNVYNFCPITFDESPHNVDRNSFK